MIERADIIKAFGVSEAEIEALDRLLGPAERQAKAEREAYEAELLRWMHEFEVQVGHQLLQPCDGLGFVPCWSPGGPCEPSERLRGCELCGPCAICRPTEYDAHVRLAHSPIITVEVGSYL